MQYFKNKKFLIPIALLISLLIIISTYFILRQIDKSVKNTVKAPETANGQKPLTAEEIKKIEKSLTPNPNATSTLSADEIKKIEESLTPRYK